MRLLILALTFVTPAITLSGCLGGPIVQQLASSLLTRSMDRITNNAYEAKQRDEKLAAERSHVLKDTPPDPYYFAFATAGFETITPVIEPVPTTGSTTPDKKIGVATSIASNAISPNPNSTITSSISQPAGNPGSVYSSAHITRLVRVEIWNLVIGDEKNEILEKARLLGEPLPPKTEWGNWKVATGAAENDKKPITFLIPPDLGSINSGDRAVVEVTEADHLYVARYAAN
jgi:hypothetical protein